MNYKLSQYLKYFSGKLLTTHYKKRFNIEIENPQLGEASEEILSIQSQVDSPSVLIDVGANIGEYSYLFHKILGCSRIICVEPNSALNDKISTNLRHVNHQIINKVVTNQVGDVKFFIHEDSQMSSMEDIDKSKYEDLITWEDTNKIQEVSIASVSLKELVNSIPEEQGDIFLKIDTQGNEIDVLRSGVGAMQRVRYVLVEFMFSNVYDRELSFNELLQFFIDQGYESLGPTNFNRRGDFSVGAVNFLFERKVK